MEKRGRGRERLVIEKSRKREEKRKGGERLFGNTWGRGHNEWSSHMPESWLVPGRERHKLLLPVERSLKGLLTLSSLKK